MLTSLALAFAALCAFSSVQAQEAPKYQQISNIVYKTVGDREIKLNLFLPLKDGQTLKGEPLLIWLDTGCWYSENPGDGGIWGAWTQWQAIERGYAVASVSHRPISETPFPAPMEDVRAAVRFLRKHADEYGYDPERFAVAGASSGGHLSLTLGISDEKSPFNVGDNLDVSGQVQRVIDFFGPTDLVTVFDRYAEISIDCIYIAMGVERSAADKKNVEQFADLQRRAKIYSPIEYIDKSFAPTIIFHGTHDPLVPTSQSAMMYERFLIEGVRSQFVVADSGTHDISTLGAPDMLMREIFEFLRW